MQPQARDISRFNPEAAENESIKADSAHTKCGVERSERAPANTRNFDDVFYKLKDSLAILIAGPDREKLALTRNLIEHHLAVAEEVVSAETFGHPSDAQLLAYARNYFVNRDLFRDVGQVAESNLSEKIDISCVLLQRVEVLPSKARVSSLEAANAILEGWASCTPDFGHDRCDFQIVFEDGFRYHGRYHLKESKYPMSLSRHIRKRLTALATIKSKRTESRTSNESVITLIGANLAEAARIALDRYSI